MAIKQVFVAALVALACAPVAGRAVGSAAQTLDPNEWTIDSQHSAAHFAVRHLVVSTVRGQLGRISGKVWYDGTAIGSVRAEASIDVKGLTSGVAARDIHLRSDDFFNADRFPVITFKSKRAEPGTAAGRFKLIGDLTIRDVTKEVTLDVEGPSPILATPQGKRVAATATLTINRFDYGLRWNNLIEAGGGAVAGQDVQITIDLEATKR